MKRIMRLFLVFFSILIATISLAQDEFNKDSTEAYFKNYVKKHSVVTGKDKELISFFPANEKYVINCRFERTMDAPWFRMESTGAIKKNYRVYGSIHFSINDTAVTLNMYQSQDLMATQHYRDHLFIPFTDATSGHETYESGRYVDLTFNDIKDDRVLIDFNRAYNPYCAYVSGKYNCPIPPAVNRLVVAIPAGEKAFKKTH